MTRSSMGSMGDFLFMLFKRFLNVGSNNPIEKPVRKI